MWLALNNVQVNEILEYLKAIVNFNSIVVGCLDKEVCKFSNDLLSKFNILEKIRLIAYEYFLYGRVNIQLEENNNDVNILHPDTDLNSFKFLNNSISIKRNINGSYEQSIIIDYLNSLNDEQSEKFKLPSKSLEIEVVDFKYNFILELQNYLIRQYSGTTKKSVEEEIRIYIL